MEKFFNPIIALCISAIIIVTALSVSIDTHAEKLRLHEYNVQSHNDNRVEILEPFPIQVSSTEMP